MFRHSKCGSDLRMDLSGCFSIQTPSVSLGVEGVMVGPLEIAEKSDKESKPRFFCPRCKETVTVLTEVEIQCQICRKYNSVKSTIVARGVGCVCSTCKSVLSGEEEPTNEHQRYTLRYLKFTSSTELVSASSALNKVVNPL